MRKIRRNDEVIVIAGKDKGKRGKVLRVKNNLLLVSGINLVKKHQKPNPNINQVGGIREKEAFISISNVAIYNFDIDKADRVGFKFLENGSKVRIFKSNGAIISDVA